MGLTDINSVRRGQEEEDGEAEGDERDQLQFSNGSSVSEIRRFEIAFDRPEALYFSGDCITGEVQISLEDTIHVKGIVVRFAGEAYVNVPAEEEGPDAGPAVKGATWQKRCKNLRTLASMGRRNKVKPSTTGMSNHGFAPTASEAPKDPGDLKGKPPSSEAVPHANGGHKVKSESADEEASIPAEENVGAHIKGEEAEGEQTPQEGPEATENPQSKILETVREEREEDLERSLEEVRLGDADGVTNGVTNGVTGGVTNGVTDAVTNGVTGSATNGVTDGVTRGVTNDVKDGVTDGVVESDVEAHAGGQQQQDRDAAVVDGKGGEGETKKKPPDDGGSVAPAARVTEGKKKRAAQRPAAESSGKKPPAARRPQQTYPPDQGVGKRRAGAKIRSHEKYFDYKFYVFGHKYSSPREHLSGGAHRFRFSYVLPGKLPSSFHGRYGYVRYFCEASLERAWAPSITRKAMFSLSATVDVNREPRAESGAGGHRSTHGCLFCCPRGTVMAEAGVRRRGFVPGERIPLRAHILNVSDRCVKRTRARLLQVVTYHSTNNYRRKVDEVVVTEAVRGQVPRGEADTWDEEGVTKGGMESQPPVSIEIPPMPANFKCSEFCKIIDVDYRLDFMVEVEGEAEPLHIRMPIVIGNVPLEKVFRTMEMGPRRRSNASTADKTDGTSPIVVPGSAQFVEFPLPRFEPCNWGPKHVEAYYHHEVARKLNEEEDITPTSEGGPAGGVAAKAAKSVTPVATAGALPGLGITLRVHRKGETFAPRYVCYKLKDPEGTANHDGSANPAGGRTSMGELSLSPLSPSHLKVMRSPSEAWIPRDTSETELVSPSCGPSGKGKRSS